ncbi:esterase [Aliidongia dinghuensis]|uniref:Esterase n=1 Tax=Aliidongia dinghuensis TaxID=1867774 RepID=A0A8J3E3I2_9PROT|nr:serine hydrolase domain-containing protein [Aliidongia dinghuensis]GGF30542.1 esterase [Aliidongia dinghuensis]
MRSPLPRSPNPRLGAGLDTVLGRALAERRIVGAVVLVAHDGQLVHAGVAGLADREAARPMREDAIFRLASITKPIVAAAAMRLVETGTLALDQPVTRWLPEFAPQLADGTAPTITIAHLLSHTAGLGYGFQEPEDGPYHRLGISDGLDQPGLSITENLDRLARAPLFYAPGTGWRYSLAMDVLGAVIEQAAGRPLPDVVRTLVTGPLGMADTGFTVTDRSRLAAAYANGEPEPTRMGAEAAVFLWDGSVRFAPDRIFDPASYPSGGAGMAGTAGDILAFLEAIRTGGAPILRPETVGTMMRNQVGAMAETLEPGWGFGYGWAVVDDPTPTGTPQSAGTIRWGGVYGHSWFVDPACRLSVVTLTNTAFEGMAGALTLEIRDAVYHGLAPR